MISIKTPIIYGNSDGLESYRYKDAIDKSRRQENVVGFLTDIYENVSAWLEKYSDDRDFMRWKQNRAQILQDWEKQVEDFNHNGYLDIAWNVIKGAVATFTDLLQTKKSSPATGRLPKDYAPEWDDDEKYLVSLYNIVSIQEAGAYVFNGRLSRAELHSKWTLLNTRKEKIARLPKIIQANPYDLAIVGKQLDHQFNDKHALSFRDLNTLAAMLEDYLSVYFTNNNLKAYGYQNVSARSLLTDFQRDHLGRAHINCGIFAKIGVALFQHLDLTKISLGHIDGFIDGERIGHLVAFAHYRNRLTNEKTMLVIDNAQVSLVPLAEKDDFEEKAREYAEAVPFRSYDKSRSISFELQQVETVEIEEYHEMTALPSSQKKESFELPASAAGVKLLIPIPSSGKQMRDLSIKGKVFHISSELLEDGQVFYSIEIPHEGRTVFGLYEPWTDRAKYNLSARFRLNHAEMLALASDLDRAKKKQMMGAISQVTEVLRDTRDTELRLQLLDIVFHIMEEVGYLPGFDRYFENETVSQAEYETQLRRLANINLQTRFENRFYQLTPSTDVSKAAFQKVGYDLSDPQRTLRDNESALAAHLLAESLKTLKDHLESIEAQHVLDRLFTLYQRTRDAFVAHSLDFLFLQAMGWSEEAEKEIERRYEAFYQTGDGMLRQLRNKPYEELSVHEKSLITYRFELATRFSNESAERYADQVFAQYTSVIAEGFTRYRFPASTLHDRYRFAVATYSRLKRISNPLSEEQKGELIASVASVIAYDLSFHDRQLMRDLWEEMLQYSPPSSVRQTKIIGLLFMRTYEGAPITSRLYKDAIWPSLRMPHNQPETFARVARDLAWTPEAAALLIADLSKPPTECNTLAPALFELLALFLERGILFQGEVEKLLAEFLKRLGSQAHDKYLALAIGYLAKNNRALADNIYTNLVVKKEEEKRKGERDPAGMVTHFSQAHIPMEAYENNSAVLASASLLCEGENVQDERCLQFGRNFGTLLRTALTDITSVQLSSEAEHGFKRVREIFRILEKRPALQQGIKDEQIILVHDLFETLLVHPNRRIRDTTIYLIAEFSDLAALYKIDVSELEQKARERLEKQQIPLGPVMRYEDIVSALTHNPDHFYRQQAATATTYVVVNAHALSELDGKTEVPEEIARRMQHLYALTQTDTSYRVAAAGERSLRLATGAVESYRSAPEAYPCPNQIEGAQLCYRQVFRTDRGFHMVPVILEDDADINHVTQLTGSLEAYYKTYPYQQHSRYFHALEGTKNQQADVVVDDFDNMQNIPRSPRLAFDRWDPVLLDVDMDEVSMDETRKPLEAGSVFYTLRVGKTTQLNDLVSQNAKPAFGQASTELRRRFMELHLLSKEKASHANEIAQLPEDDFHQLWKGWHDNSEMLWTQAVSKHEEGNSLPMEKLLVMLQILTSETSDLFLFSSSSSVGKWNIIYDGTQTGRIQRIKTQRKEFQFSYGADGRLSSLQG